MSTDRGESQEIARLLATGYTDPHGSASNGTMETKTGHAFMLTRDGQEYVVLVVPNAASPLIKSEFEEYGR
jgi:hypothetical protein